MAHSLIQITSSYKNIYETTINYFNGDAVNKTFSDIIDSLPKLQEQLINSSQKHRGNLGDIPKSGIYVFYENGIPMYVGRTNRMKKRIMEHGRPSANHNTAQFAFLIAKEAAKEKGIDVSNMTRGELKSDPNFNDLFSQSKNRVSKMSIRLVSVEDQIKQVIFQVYASMELETPFNDFNTH